MKHFLLLFACVALCACTQHISTAFQSIRDPLPSDAEVRVIDLDEQIPANAEMLGTIYVGDSGFSVNFGYDAGINTLRKQAREVGGNAVKITAHSLPSFLSSCHRFSAQILVISDAPATEERIDSALMAEGCCMVHIYRFSGVGGWISYDLKVNDEIVTKVTNNSKMSAKMIAAGPTAFRATTQASEETTIDLQPGHHYYIRCSVIMGETGGRPSMVVINSNSGKREYDTLRTE